MRSRLFPLALVLATVTATPPARATAAPAAPTEPAETAAPAPRLPTVDLRAEIDRLRASNRLLARRNEDLAQEIARVRARLAELDPDGSLAAAACPGGACPSVEGADD